MTFRETADSESRETNHRDSPATQPKAKARKASLPAIEAEPSGVELEEEERAKSSHAIYN